MYTQIDRIGQLAHEHHREMLAEARRRQLRHQPGRPAPRTSRASTIARRLSAAFAKARVATASR
jgi:hypothetical protein